MTGNNKKTAANTSLTAVKDRTMFARKKLSLASVCKETALSGYVYDKIIQLSNLVSQ